MYNEQPDFTSRSAIESYHTCPRLRWNQYHLLGKGVVGKALSVPLVTGGSVHRGVEHLANRVRIGQAPDLDTAVGLAVEEYEKECQDAGFSGRGLQTDQQQWFTFNEQKALVEGLIRAWGLIELPNIVQRYKIVAVEREILPVRLVENVYLQAKVDMELQELATSDYYNYSLKTCNMWGERSEQSYKSDLQGVTETWSIEQESIEKVRQWKQLILGFERLSSIEQGRDAKLNAVLAYLQKNAPDTRRLMGVRFCFLVKGIRKKPDYYANNSNAPHITYSPLIRGYRYITPSGTSYAHSWFYPNPDNKSGRSILGKGWEPFNVWESEISIKDWVNALYQNLIQPECGNVLQQNVITPPEYFRDDAEVAEAIRQVQAQEGYIAERLTLLDDAAKDSPDIFNEILGSTFPHRRKLCWFMYGEPCPYIPLCWKPEVAADPLGSGLYQIRVPHHLPEREES